MGSKHIKIGNERLLHPDYLKELAANRVLSYYRQNVAGLPGKYVYCDCCGERMSQITINDLTAKGRDLEEAEEIVEDRKNMEDMFIKYKNTVKSILDEKDHVE